MPDFSVVMQWINFGALAFMVYAMVVKQWLVPGHIYRDVVEQLKKDHEERVQEIKQISMDIAQMICAEKEDDFKKIVTEATTIALKQSTEQNRQSEELISAVYDIKNTIAGLTSTQASNTDVAVSKALERALAGLAIKTVEVESVDNDSAQNYKRLVIQLKKIVESFESSKGDG